jgi:acetoin utilization protein AcuA
LTDHNHIIGFGVLAYPEPDERWNRLGPRLMMEVKAIEVSRSWRSAGVAGGIIQTMMSRPMIEDKIIYMVGYSWTWDLDGAGQSAQEYRRMLINLFEPCGFQEYQTNESNICLKPENILLGRIGRNVTKEQKDDFKWLRFNLLNT